MSLRNYLDPDYFRMAMQNPNDPLYKKEMNDLYVANLDKLSIEEMQQRWIDQQVAMSNAERENFLDERIRQHQLEEAAAIQALDLGMKEAKEEPETKEQDIGSLEALNLGLAQEIEKNQAQLQGLYVKIQTIEAVHIKNQEMQTQRIVDHFKTHNEVVVDDAGHKIKIQIDNERERELLKILAPAPISKLVKVNPALIEGISKDDEPAITERAKVIDKKGDFVQELNGIKWLSQQVQRLEGPDAPQEVTGAALLKLIKLNQGKFVPPKAIDNNKASSAQATLTTLIQASPEIQKLEREILLKEKEMEKNNQKIQELRQADRHRPRMDIIQKPK